MVRLKAAKQRQHERAAHARQAKLDKLKESLTANEPEKDVEGDACPQPADGWNLFELEVPDPLPGTNRDVPLVELPLRLPQSPGTVEPSGPMTTGATCDKPGGSKAAAGDIYGMMDFHTGGDSEVEEAQGPAAAPNIEGLHILDPQDITCRGKLLGVGGYGAANLAKFQGGYVAFKSIPEPQPIAGTYGKTELSDLHNRKILNEAAPLLRLRHARIVQLVGVVLEGDSRGLVMEYLPTTLEKWLKRQRLQMNIPADYSKMPDQLPVKFQLQQLDILQQLAGVLNYLNAKDCCHCDLKPENVGVRPLAVDGQCSTAVELKLLDFGLSRRKNVKGFVGFVDSITEEVRGTRGWASPEVMNRSVKSTDQFETYSFGTTAWQVVTLGTEIIPSALALSHRIQMAWKGFKPPAPPVATCHPALHQLLVECCSYLPDNRPSMREVLCRLQRIHGELAAQLSHIALGNPSVAFEPAAAAKQQQLLPAAGPPAAAGDQQMAIRPSSMSSMSDPSAASADADGQMPEELTFTAVGHGIHDVQLKSSAAKAAAGSRLPGTLSSQPQGTVLEPAGSANRTGKATSDVTAVVTLGSSAKPNHATLHGTQQGISIEQGISRRSKVAGNQLQVLPAADSLMLSSEASKPQQAIAALAAAFNLGTGGTASHSSMEAKQGQTQSAASGASSTGNQQLGHIGRLPRSASRSEGATDSDQLCPGSMLEAGCVLGPRESAGTRDLPTRTRRSVYSRQR